MTFNLRTIVTALVLSLLPSATLAQTVRATRMVLSPGPCTMRSGSGSPEGVVTGRVCDTFWRTDTGTIYTKVSGTGNTGWSGSGVTGSGTTGMIPKWTSPTSLGDTELLISGKSVVPLLSYDINLGSLTKKYLSLHAAELWVETLVAQNTLATIGGRILILPTNILVGDMNTSNTSIVVKYNNFANGDVVLMEENGQVEFIGMTSSASGSSGAYTYTVARNLDGSGANAWTSGAAMANTGTTGNGFIDVYSVRGVKAGTEIGPTIVGNVRNSATYNDWTPRWAIGNLNGLYGYGVNVYGAAFGVPSGAWIKIDPTNGIRLGHSATTKISLDAATGNASFAGAITSDSGTIGGWTIIAGYLYSGATNTARVGIKASDVAASVAFYAGDFNEAVAPFRVSHDGTLFASSATITGSVTATSGAVGGWTLSSTTLTGGNAVLTNSGNFTLGTSNDVVRVSADDGTYRLWIGNATAGSAPFRVSKTGALTATSATITGTITGSTITSSSLTAGGGDVVIDSNGISISAGSGASKHIKWSNNADIYGNSTYLALFGGGEIRLDSTGGSLTWTGSVLRSDSTADLGSSADKFNRLWLSSLTGTGNRAVCVNSSGELYAAAGLSC